MTPAQRAVAFLERVAAGEVALAFEAFVGEAFRHHNPAVPGDAASLRSAMEADAAANPGKVLVVKQVLAEGDRVMVLSWIRQHSGDRGYAVVHLFRFHGDRIVELWDVVQAVPDHGPNVHGMF